MKSYSKLSACPRPGARHVLSLRYSLSCYCSLLLSYLYNKACHSLCLSFICVQFKGSPSEVWFSPCQDLVCAAVLWAVTSFWLSIIQIFAYKGAGLLLFVVWSAEWKVLSRSVRFALRGQNCICKQSSMAWWQYPFHLKRGLRTYETDFL